MMREPIGVSPIMTHVPVASPTTGAVQYRVLNGSAPRYGIINRSVGAEQVPAPILTQPPA